VDTAELESSYRSLLDLARGGAFRPPAVQGDWPAELILAHIAFNDRLLIAVTASLLAGDRPSYDNTAAGSGAALQALAQAAGDWGGLVATVRQCGLELVLVARQLDAARAATAVPTRIVDGGAVRADGPVPWAGVLNTQAQVHLPSHTEQLRAMR